MDLLTLDISSRWSHTVWDFFVCLSSHVWPLFEAHPCVAHTVWYSFHWADISHCVYSFIGYGHLGCFYFWVILNKAAKTFVYKCLCRHVFSVLVGIDLGVELLNHMVTMLVFNEMQDYFLKASFYTPSNMRALICPHPTQDLLSCKF